MPWFFILLQTFNRVSGEYWIGETPSFINCILFVFRSNCSGLFVAIFVIATILYILYRNNVLNTDFENKKLKIELKWKEYKSSTEVSWMIIGIFSLLATIVTGIVVSKLVRPVFITRYIYPISVTIWLIFAMAISNFKKSKMYVPIVLVIILISTIPNYLNFFSETKEYNELQQMTLEKTQNINRDNTIVYTNIKQMEFTIMEYYYPKAKTIMFDYDLSKLSQENNYWFVISQKIPNELIQDLNKHGYTYNTIVEDGIIGNFYVYIYEIIEI